MTTVFEPVRAARLAWERTQPQLFFQFEEPVRVAATPVAPLATANTTGSSIHIGAVPVTQSVPGKGRCPSEGRAAPNTTTNGDRCSTYPGSAAVASQETL